MRKILSIILTFSMLFCMVRMSPVHASNDIVYVGEGYIKEVETNNPDTKRWIVVDSGVQYDLFINYKEHYLKIDDEVIPYTVEEIELPVTRATIDYSTAKKFQSKIPWKGSVTLLAAGIGAISGIDAAGIAATIASALTADAENVWMTFTQYESKESYYSNYNAVYYKKCINKNVTFYKTSISSANKIYGPVQGSWFDPIRP